MLEKLIELTGSKEYRENGGMRIKEVLMQPWLKNEMKILIEVYIDDWQSEIIPTQIWEITANGLMYDTPRGIGDGKPPGTQIKVFNNHPVLWNYSASSYLSVSGRCMNVAELIGDLFIAHQQACGGWVDFQDMYSDLAGTLASDKEHHREVPVQLAASFISVFTKHGLNVTVDRTSESEEDLLVLLFSTPHMWPDEFNVGQAHIVAKSFAEKKLGEGELKIGVVRDDKFGEECS